MSLTVHRYAISGGQFCKLIIMALLTASVAHRIIRVILLCCAYFVSSYFISSFL